MGPLKILLRNVFAAVAGVILAFLLVSIAQMINSRIYPPPPGMDFRDKVAVAEYLKVVPVGALIGVLVGYFIGVAGGTWLATRISVSRHARQGLMVGVLFLVASLMNLSSMPHPVWFWVGNLLVVPVAAWLGIRFGEPEDRALD